MLSNLITGRTAADISYLLQQIQKWQNGTMNDEEKTEFLSGLKGAYNCTDLNRVTLNWMKKRQLQKFFNMWRMQDVAFSFKIEKEKAVLSL